MTIDVAFVLTTDGIDFLMQWINAETLDVGEAHSFAFFMRDENQEIITGCNGSVLFGAIDTDQLWVHPRHRNMGLGTQRMNAVHAHGRQEGCLLAAVRTMSVQGAHGFYQKWGYAIDFERLGYDHGARCLMLRKELV